MPSGLNGSGGRLPTPPHFPLPACCPTKNAGVIDARIAGYYVEHDFGMLVGLVRLIYARQTNARFTYAPIYSYRLRRRWRLLE